MAASVPPGILSDPVFSVRVMGGLSDLLTHTDACACTHTFTHIDPHTKISYPADLINLCALYAPTEPTIVPKHVPRVPMCVNFSEQF